MFDVFDVLPALVLMKLRCVLLSHCLLCAQKQV